MLLTFHARLSLAEQPEGLNERKNIYTEDNIMHMCTLIGRIHVIFRNSPTHKHTRTEDRAHVPVFLWFKLSSAAETKQRTETK